MRLLPELTPENRAFWTGGEHGELAICQCRSCGRWTHPPEIVCPFCLSAEIAPKAVAGTGTIYSFTINHQPWLPGMAVPFVLAVVDMDGAQGVRITGELREIAPDEAAIGMAVRTRFERCEDVWIPYFVPVGAETPR